MSDNVRFFVTGIWLGVALFTAASISRMADAIEQANRQRVLTNIELQRIANAQDRLVAQGVK